MVTTRSNALALGATLLLAAISQGCASDMAAPLQTAADHEASIETAGPWQGRGWDRRPVTGQAGLTVIAGLTVDAHGVPVIPTLADPATPLYYARTGKPVLAPDGRHVTAGEFSAVTGSVSVRCVERGTEVRVHLRNLIPRATYRVWLLTFKAPGFSIGPPPDFSNLIGEGALGPEDRSRNTFIASASGEGQITRIHPAGPLSETLPEPPFTNEPVGRCLLTDEFEWHAVGAFQQPGHPAGPNVGTPALFPGTAVEHFVGIFRRAP